ncbi:MAG: thioredoxin domain-containing protein [Anaerolineales bacterium]|nr:thioredoxin domain-containing protein [Anaerolineales bacterium]MBX3037541.1 thioredoxin domain-containing protein [Anaerolineales bacterium]
MSDKEVSKRQQRKEQVRRKERRSRLLAIGFVSVGVLFLAFLFIWPSLRPIGEVATAPEIVYPNPDFNAVGNPDALIKIEEYADFQCPHCGSFFRNTEKLLMDNYIANGTVYFVFKAVDYLGAASAEAAEAAYCAGDQNKFWEMQGTIFTNQGLEALSDRRLAAYAESVGLNMDEYNECYNSNKYLDLVAENVATALNAGAEATPSFVMTYEVNGETKTKLIQGAQPYDIFVQEIEAALAEINQ